MAKQKHGHSDYTNSPRSQRRQRQRQQHSASLACPSSSVLSILATIAASSHAVDGSPLPLPTPPPPFLCPFINYDSFQPRTPTPTTASSSSIFYPTSSLSSVSLPGSESNRKLADKYVQGADGLWRKTDAWTLFGSACCSTSSDLAVDTTTTIQSDQLDTVLPAGWTTSGSSTNRTDSIIILSLAIVLAVTICFFMVGCIIWRRRRKKQTKREKQMNDLELKAKHKRNIEDASEDGEREKEARGKLRLWGKASARWRSGIRYSARRRKNLRRVASTGRLSRPQSPILPEASEVPITSSSPSSSRRHSIISSSEDSHAATIHSPENSPTVTQPLHTLTPSSPPIVSSPPAYMFPAPPPVNEDYTQGAFHANSSGVMSESLLVDRHDFPLAPVDDDIPYQPGYAAHIAIDDKAHLARMADLASAPPANQPSTSESFPVHESAPEWQDEEFQSHPGTPTTSPFDVGTSGLPMPPSKSLLSPRYFDVHSYLEDITALDHMTLPSMPPYEEGPSALPFQEVLHASAPPLSTYDQAFEHWESSAPELSDADGECTTDVPSSSLQPPLSRQLSASSARPSAPPDEAFVGGNGALPIYQP